jgi:transcriptional regulator NrdR family protein
MTTIDIVVDEKFNRFDMEDQIMACWGITNDLRDLSEGLLESDMSNEHVANALIGLQQLYQIRFEKLFRQFEQLVHQHHSVLDGASDESV